MEGKFKLNYTEEIKAKGRAAGGRVGKLKIGRSRSATR